MIGTLAAIGLGLAGAGTAASGIASGNAANKASQVAQQTAQQNNALARDIYGQNYNLLSPYVGSGQAAGGQINAMLGLGGGSAGGSSSMPDWNLYLQNNPDVLQGYYTTADKNQFASPTQYAQWHYGNYGQREGRAFPTTAATSPGAPAGNPWDGFKNYLAGSNYAFDLGQGLNAVNSGYAGSGSLKSGAAMKGIEDYRQGLQGQYRGEYMNALANQQSVGLGAGSALAGVGQNYVNTVGSNNNGASSAVANAALYKAQNSPFNALSLVGGGLFGYGR